MQQGVPHVVTARPSAIPDSGVTELSIAVEIAAVLKREVHRVVGMYKPTWNPSAINSKVSITLHATNLTGGGAQTMDRFKSLRHLKPQDILDILEKIAYTGITVFDIEWLLTIVLVIFHNRYHPVLSREVEMQVALLITVLRKNLRKLGAIKLGKIKKLDVQLSLLTID